MVQKILDRVLHTAKVGPPIPFILDGTFSYAKAHENVKRALERGYALEIYYVYQKPTLAWQFTKARQKRDGRAVSKDIFIATFLQARNNVLMVKKTFGDKVNVSVIIKNDDAKQSEAYAYLSYDELEQKLPMSYNEDVLRKEL
jgi:predicted ABC-type ATPase